MPSTFQMATALPIEPHATGARSRDIRPLWYGGTRTRICRLVDPARLELALPVCRTGILPLDDGPLVESARIELAFPRCERSVFPLDDDPMGRARGVEPPRDLIHSQAAHRLPSLAM